ncbi:hypothetical protein L6452_04228 [Arctium lappa]|uniref:Uncharacterized protein n=1 Tax=Arctium lappa TaxID=4217 RepID=A0ACB9FPW3_ARCLA|nr:hypothetical protein L6452_04228 [Arctium lappa]
MVRGHTPPSIATPLSQISWIDWVEPDWDLICLLSISSVPKDTSVTPCCTTLLLADLRVVFILRCWKGVVVSGANGLLAAADIDDVSVPGSSGLLEELIGHG